jgi:hypothetical protein
VLTDWASTQIALLSDEGEIASESFLSTASTRSSGLAFALSGDVVLASERPASGEVVLLDRYGTNVISWASPKTARVRAQLAVGTGFESNPQDYLELAKDRAYVTRWGENGSPGQEPLDAGSDVLIIDPSVPKLEGRIELPRADGLPPRPGSMLRVGESVLLVLERLALDYAKSGPSWLVGIDSRFDRVAWKLELDGLVGCGKPVISPDGETLAVACSGKLDGTGDVSAPERTGVLLLDAREMPPRVLRRLDVFGSLKAPPQRGLAFASEHTLLGKTQTPLGGAEHNRLFAIDLRKDTFKTLVAARPDADGKGRGVVFGDLLCAPGCSDLCFLADAEAGAIRRWRADDTLASLESVLVGGVGLPPRGLGSY